MSGQGVFITPGSMAQNKQTWSPMTAINESNGMAGADTQHFDALVRMLSGGVEGSGADVGMPDGPSSGGGHLDANIAAMARNAAMQK